MNVTATNQSIYEDDHTTTIQSAELSSAAALEMAARSNMYALLADVFRYPDSDFIDFVRQEELRTALLDISSGLPYAFDLSQEEKAALKISDELDDDDVEAGFIRIFEAGPGDPPCPLVEGKYVKDANRRAIFEDLIRFYNHFGLSYKEGTHDDRPDHITYEMEFMHYMSFLSLKAVQEAREKDDYFRAQKDFLEHHLLKWTEGVAKVLEEVVTALKQDAAAMFYANLAVLMDRYVRADYDYLAAVLEDSLTSD
ncbi:MAG: molecular chaperone TorD family protein [Desulfosudaceae bacterium]